MDRGLSQKGASDRAAAGEAGKATKRRSHLTQALKNPHVSQAGKKSIPGRQNGTSKGPDSGLKHRPSPQACRLTSPGPSDPTLGMVSTGS